MPRLALNASHLDAEGFAALSLDHVSAASRGMATIVEAHPRSSVLAKIPSAKQQVHQLCFQVKRERQPMSRDTVLADAALLLGWRLLLGRPWYDWALNATTGNFSQKRELEMMLHLGLLCHLDPQQIVQQAGLAPSWSSNAAHTAENGVRMRGLTRVGEEQAEHAGAARVHDDAKARFSVTHWGLLVIRVEHTVHCLILTHVNDVLHDALSLWLRAPVPLVCKPPFPWRLPAAVVLRRWKLQHCRTRDRVICGREAKHPGRPRSSHHGAEPPAPPGQQRLTCRLPGLLVRPASFILVDGLQFPRLQPLVPHHLCCRTCARGMQRPHRRAQRCRRLGTEHSGRMGQRRGEGPAGCTERVPGRGTCERM